MLVSIANKDNKTHANFSFFISYHPFWYNKYS
jgi:hypothetical protein